MDLLVSAMFFGVPFRFVPRHRGDASLDLPSLVALDRDLFGDEPQLARQRGDGRAGAHPAVLALDGNGDGAVQVSQDAISPVVPSAVEGR